MSQERGPVCVLPPSTKPSLFQRSSRKSSTNKSKVRSIIITIHSYIYVIATKSKKNTFLSFLLCCSLKKKNKKSKEPDSIRIDNILPHEKTTEPPVESDLVDQTLKQPSSSSIDEKGILTEDEETKSDVVVTAVEPDVTHAQTEEEEEEEKTLDDHDSNVSVCLFFFFVLLIVV